MKPIDTLRDSIVESSQIAATNYFDLLSRERKVIHVDVLKEYFLSDEEGKKRLIQIYGNEPFLYMPFDEVVFASFLLKEYTSGGQKSFPFKYNGKVMEISITVKEEGGDVSKHDFNLLGNFKDFLNKKKFK